MSSRCWNVHRSKTGRQRIEASACLGRLVVEGHSRRSRRHLPHACTVRARTTTVPGAARCSPSSARSPSSSSAVAKPVSMMRGRNISPNETISRWYQSSTMSTPACDIARTSTSPTSPSKAGRRRPMNGSRYRECHSLVRMIRGPSPCRVGGFALPTQPVDLLDGDGAAGTDDGHGFAEDGERVGHVDEHEPDVGEVEAAPRKLGGDRVAELEADVGGARRTCARRGRACRRGGRRRRPRRSGRRAPTVAGGCRPDHSRCRRSPRPPTGTIKLYPRSQLASSSINQRGLGDQPQALRLTVAEQVFGPFGGCGSRRSCLSVDVQSSSLEVLKNVR